MRRKKASSGAQLSYGKSVKMLEKKNKRAQSGCEKAWRKIFDSLIKKAQRLDGEGVKASMSLRHVSCLFWATICSFISTATSRHVAAKMSACRRKRHICSLLMEKYALSKNNITRSWRGHQKAFYIYVALWQRAHLKENVSIKI